MITDLSAILFAIFLAVTPLAGHAFDSAPHVLVLPGHTNSLSQGPGGEVLVTCDYKTLDGRVPKPGEPCTGEPTLAISVQDLKNLRYISEAKDNNELVRRVYEKYDDIVFIVSPDFKVDFGNSGYNNEVSPVTVRHPDVPEDIYHSYSKVVDSVLSDNGKVDSDPNEFLIGITYPPYSYHPSFTKVAPINPLQNQWRPLSEYYLIFLPANPAKTTMVHELLHYLMDSPKNRAIASPERRTQILKNSGLREFIEAEVLTENPTLQMEEDLRAAYEVSKVLYQVEHVDDVVPEEIEVNYFIAKYREDLGLSMAAQDHIDGFWNNVKTYKRQIDIMDNGSFLISSRTQRYIWDDLPLEVGNMVRPSYYRNIWANVLRLAKEYPRGLLGDEINPRPGTMMYQFIRDIGTRAETGR